MDIKKRPRLIMTLLVRDEADIVEKNICFHLNHGVDFIIASDNNSKDSTPSILKRYQKKGVLSYRSIKENTYEQSKWVSRMAKEAVEKRGATHLFHCDADEFWYPSSGDLKTDLPRGNEVFYVPLIDYLPEEFLINSLFNMTKMVVVNPYDRYAQRLTDESYRYLLYKFQQKVMTTSKFTNIAMGNHLINDKKKQERIDVNHILIHHFPIRSYQQFKSKVINGGSGYENNPNKNPDIVWHWQDWYQLYKKGLLKDVFRQLCVTSSERRILINRGMIKKIRIPMSILMAKTIYRVRKKRD